VESAGITAKNIAAFPLESPRALQIIFFQMMGKIVEGADSLVSSTMCNAFKVVGEYY